MKNDGANGAQLAAACEPVWEPHKADIHSYWKAWEASTGAKSKLEACRGPRINYKACREAYSLFICLPKAPVLSLLSIQSQFS